MKSKLFLIIFCISLIIPSALAADQTADNYLYFPIPEKKIVLKINLPGFKKIEEESDESSFYARNDKTYMNMGFIVGKAQKKGGADVCRNEVWTNALENNGIEKSKVKDWKFNDMYFKDYMVYAYEGETINQKNLTGCLVSNGLWILIQIDKFNYKSKDLKLFTDILRSIKIIDMTKYEKETAGRTNVEKIKNTQNFQNYLKANAYFEKGDYKNAIVYYKKALEAEKAKRTFGEIEWKIMVDNFGMAYGISEDFKNAQVILEYGVKNYPDYPNFYYNLACNSAEQNKLPETIKYLEKAYLYRKNVLPGEVMPDPMADSSFKAFLSNEEFTKLAKKFTSK